MSYLLKKASLYGLPVNPIFPSLNKLSFSSYSPKSPLPHFCLSNIPDSSVPNEENAFFTFLLKFLQVYT